MKFPKELTDFHKKPLLQSSLHRDSQDYTNILDEELCNRKIPVLESLFHNVNGLQACSFISNERDRYFSENFLKFFRTPYRKPPGDCFCH